MSELDNNKVKKLNCTERWRKFYKGRAQTLKDSDHPDRTGKLARDATTAVGIRRGQLQDDWRRLLIEIAASAASVNLRLPPNYVADAAVMLFTCRAMKRLGLDGYSDKNVIYQEACIQGGVEDRTLLRMSWEYSKYLVTELQRKARLEQMRRWLEWFLTYVDVQEASGVADQMVETYKTLEVVKDMTQALVTTRASHDSVLRHLEGEARNYHISDLIKAAIDQTQKSTYEKRVNAAAIVGLGLAGVFAIIIADKQAQSLK